MASVCCNSLPTCYLWKQVQDLCLTVSHYRWEEEEVNRRLDKAMTDSFAAIWEVHNQKNIPLRVAAFHVALQRVTRAHVHRGFD